MSLLTDATFHPATLLRTICLTGLMVCLILAPGQAATDERPGEYQVKAAFILNFARFVEWPPEAFSDAQAPLIVGLIGDDPFDGSLAGTLNGKTVGGRTLTYKKIRNQSDLKSCHILFISPTEKRRIKQTLAALRGNGVLTISEVEEFTRLGGIVNFFITPDNKVAFEINVDAAGQAQLKISSRVLKLARVTKGSGGTN
jgi:hypothetical protein